MWWLAVRPTVTWTSHTLACAELSWATDQSFRVPTSGGTCFTGRNVDAGAKQGVDTWAEWGSTLHAFVKCPRAAAVVDTFPCVNANTRSRSLLSTATTLWFTTAAFSQRWWSASKETPQGCGCTQKDSSRGGLCCTECRCQHTRAPSCQGVQADCCPSCHGAAVLPC